MSLHIALIGRFRKAKLVSRFRKPQESDKNKKWLPRKDLKAYCPINYNETNSFMNWAGHRDSSIKI